MGRGGRDILGSEEWGVEAESVQDAGENKRVQCCTSKLLLFNDLEWSSKKKKPSHCWALFPELRENFVSQTSNKLSALITS